MPKKNVLAIMLGGKGPKGRDKDPEKKDEDSGSDSDYGEGFNESAKEAMAALQDGDSAKFASSLKDAIITCVEDHERGDY